MEVLEKSTELIKVEEITSTMQNAGLVLTKNENLVNKAVAGGQVLIDTAASGMSDELDNEMNNWQVKAKEALRIMNERRSPITQLMTKVAKVFTGMEAKLDPAKTDSIFYQIQDSRNSWAKEKAEERRKAEAEILRKQKIASEKIEISGIIEKQIRDAFNSKIFEFKAFYTKKFNEITLDNIDTNSAILNKAHLSYPIDKYGQIDVSVISAYIDQDDLNSMINSKRDELYNELNADFHLSIETLRDDLLSKIPSKRTELERISKASKEEADRLKQEAAEREKLDAERLKDEQFKSQQATEQKVSEQTEIQKVNTLFATQSEIATVAADDKPIRESYTISVLSYAGWMQITSFWFEREGKTLAPDKFEKKTLGQMKAFAEKAALKDDKEKINSSHLVYEETFKAVVKK